MAIWGTMTLLSSRLSSCDVESGASSIGVEVERVLNPLNTAFPIVVDEWIVETLTTKEMGDQRTGGEVMLLCTDRD